MLGQIRLGFFVDGIGYHKECSKLLFPIDSSSNLKVFVNGAILDIDEQLYKVQSVELAFIDYPGRKNFERQKPIKMIYVSKAKTELMGDDTKRSAIRIEEIAPAKDANLTKDIVDDKYYCEQDFADDFPHLTEKPKRKGRPKSDERKAKPRHKSKPKKTKTFTEEKVEIKIQEPKKRASSKKSGADTVKRSSGNIKKKASTRSRTVKSPPKSGKVTPAKAIKAVKSVKTKETKATRRKRCKTCDKLFKNIKRHVCKI